MLAGASLPLPTGTTRATFYWKGAVVQAATVDAAAGTWPVVPIAATVTPAARDHLVLVSGGGQSVPAGSCSAAVVLESRDAFGNVSGVGPATSIGLTGPADFLYFTDPACAVPAAASLPLPAGTSQVNFWFKGTVVTAAPPATVTASVSGWAPLPIDETIVPAARDHLVLVSGGGQVVAEHPGAGAVHHIQRPGHRIGGHRQAGGHGFQQHKAKSVGAAGEDEDIAGGVVGG